MDEQSSEPTSPGHAAALRLPEAQPENLSQKPRDEQQLGFYEIVEAFTALRQQWRTGAKESRDLAEAVQATAENIAELQESFGDTANRLQLIARRSSPEEASLPLVKCIAEMDRMVRRGVESLERSLEATPPKSLNGDNQQTEDGSTHNFVMANLSVWIEQQLVRLPGWRRVVIRPFALAIQSRLSDLQKNQVPAAIVGEHSAELVGMQMLLDRMQQMLIEHGIRRIDTVGLPFDGQYMIAIDVVSMDVVDPEILINAPDNRLVQQGVVVHQHSPAYRWEEKIIRFAEVRVAR